MRAILITAMTAGLSALTLAACDGGNTRVETRTLNDDGGPLRVVDALQCPQTQGSLTRRGGPAADGLSCTYAGPRGSEVTLHLVSLHDGDVDAALAPYERDLSAQLPAAQVQLASAPMPPEPPLIPDAPETPAAPGERVDVDMPGLKVRAEGEDAVVRLPGMSIDASGDTARVRIGGMEINADDATSTVTVATADDSVDVRSQGDATVVRTRQPGRSVRARFILTDGSGDDRGLWRTVGYEARGPSGGPIVVATVKTKDDRDEALFDAARALLRLNVGN